MALLKIFLVTSVSYIEIVYSYFFAAFIVSMVITLFVYLGIELFFVAVYQDVSSISTVLFSIFIIFCSNIISSLLMLFVAQMIRSFTSFSTFETIYGVVIGFFTGVYIPIGYYPRIIRNIFFYFPLCQTTSLLRNVQTDMITSIILNSYPKEQHKLLYEIFGIHLSFNNQTFSTMGQLSMIFVVIILLNLLLIFLIDIKRNYK